MLLQGGSIVDSITRLAGVLDAQRGFLLPLPLLSIDLRFPAEEEFLLPVLPLLCVLWYPLGWKDDTRPRLLVI